MNDLQIDETAHVPEPSAFQRVKHALYAVVLGIVLVQMYYFWISFQTGNLGTTFSVVLLADSPYFLGFLAVCALMGWLRGPRFHEWLTLKMSHLKFW